MVQLWCVIVGYGTVIMVCDRRLGYSCYGDSRLWCSYCGDSKTKFIRNYFTWMAPKAARNAVSLYEGASPRVTGLNLDQWTSR